MKNFQKTFFRIPKVAKTLLGISGVLIIGSWILLANNDEPTITLRGINNPYLEKNFSKGHMANVGNDFGAGFLWLPSKDIGDNPKILKIDNTTYTCRLQVRGFYYNTQRGARLWALDQDTQKILKRSDANYNENNFAGGRFTLCDDGNGKVDPFGIYGYITHDDTAMTNQKFHLYAGVEYNIKINQPTNNFACNFQRINNAYPIGLFYDTAWGVGLVGMTLKNINNHSKVLTDLSSKCMVDQFSYNEDSKKVTPNEDNQNLTPEIDIWEGDAKETIFQLGIKGIIGFSNEVSPGEQKSFDGNQDGSSVIINTDQTISDIINLSNKNAENICRGKWTSSTSNIWTNKLLCLEGNGSNMRFISEYAGKTIIVKNGSLTLNKYMTQNDEPTTIFINKGNLYLPNRTQTNESLPLQQFVSNGYIAQTQKSNSNPKGNYLKGNFILNGLLQGKDYQPIKHRLVIHGKFASFNTLIEPSNAEKWNLITNIGLQNIDQNKIKIGFNNIFSRTCNVNGIGSDNTACKVEDSKNSISNKAFNLIDMNFASPLFQ